MTFLKRLFGATKKTEHFDSKQGNLSEEITECVKCGGRNFKHDSYWDEYSCENCGWTSKEKPKGKVKVRELQTKDKEKAKSKKEPMMSEHVVQIDNRSTSDNWIVNSTDMHITVACNQPQAGKFSINLQPGQRQRVAPRIQAQPYPYGKQKYDQFQYHLNSSETWEVHLDSGQLVMQTKDKEKAGVGERASAAEFSEQQIRRSISDLVSDNEDVREPAFEALKKAGDAAVQPLIETLEHENLMVRRQAAEALGTISTSACIQALLNVFSDPRPEMFRRANYALWLIGEPAVSSLVEKLRDDDPNVRSRAAIALGQMIHRRTADPSDRIWLDPSAIDAADNIRGEINVEAVRSEARGPLEKLLQDEDVSVRKHALIALETGYREPDRKKEAEAKKRESVAERKKAEMGVPPLHVREEERDEKRAEWLDKAKKLKEEGQHEKAIEYWDLVMRANLDGNGWAHYLKGCALAGLDRPEEAAECLKDALELDPDHSSCALELGRVLHKLGRWDEARSAFKKVLTMSFKGHKHDDKAMEWLEKMDEEGH